MFACVKSSIILSARLQKYVCMPTQRIFAFFAAVSPFMESSKTTHCDGARFRSCAACKNKCGCGLLGRCCVPSTKASNRLNNPKRCAVTCAAALDDATAHFMPFSCNKCKKFTKPGVMSFSLRLSNVRCIFSSHRSLYFLYSWSVTAMPALFKR